MRIFRILYLLLAMCYLAGCAKNEVIGIGQQGEYLSNFDFPTTKVFAPGKVGITNRSKNADKFQWEFNGAKRITSQGDTVEYLQSDKMVPDSAFYELPGEYEVKLTTWQGNNKLETVKKIVIEKQQPSIIVPENIGVFTEVEFSAQVFKYPNQAVAYSWDFGNGETSSLEKPKVIFTTEGLQIVRLTINDGQETLSTEVTVLVQGELAKTIYFTDAYTRRIYKYKLTTQSQSEVEWIGVSTGYNAFGLTVNCICQKLD
jgi:hypothetical protein